MNENEARKERLDSALHQLGMMSSPTVVRLVRAAVGDFGALGIMNSLYAKKEGSVIICLKGSVAFRAAEMLISSAGHQDIRLYDHSSFEIIRLDHDSKWKMRDRMRMTKAFLDGETIKTKPATSIPRSTLGNSEPACG
jgi:hypothetical protein